MTSRLVLVILALVLGACSSDDGNDGRGETAPSRVLSRDSGAPPWTVGDNQAERIANAGLPRLKAEGDKVHYHAHLDVFYNGEAVEVPADIGIDYDEKVISPLHTHTAAGILHVEANEAAEFTLRHLLIQWGINPGLPLKVYENGQEQPDGLSHVIRADTQIAMVYGTPPAVIPATYDCARSPDDSCDKIPQP